MSLSFMEGNEALTGGAIADVQRLGPSPGSATRGADSDIQFLQCKNNCWKVLLPDAEFNDKEEN